jgi:SAM-dependent methyltransferase
MSVLQHALRWLPVVCFAVAAAVATAAEVSKPEAAGEAEKPSAAEEAKKPYVPVEGQAGRDAVWVPTPLVLVEKMLDLAKVTPKDFVMDLGSGDGRNIIAAAKRGVRGLGVEYNPDLVEFSRRLAEKEGVADKAQFVQGDMYVADISKATVLALFLLPENMEKMKQKFLDLRPGSRIVMNAFEIPDWSPDATERAEGDCGAWCTAHLYIVPAKVAGTWKLPVGELTLQQKYQNISGSLHAGGKRMPISNARLRGDRISFTVGGVSYVGRVNGDEMSGKTKGGSAGTWSAARAS